MDETVTDNFHPPHKRQKQEKRWQHFTENFFVKTGETCLQKAA
jgi:hypothetical protein